MRASRLATKILLIAVVGGLAAACGSAAASPSPVVSPTVAPTPRAPDVPLATRPPVVSVPAGIMETIEQEAARLAGVSADQLTLLRADQITWPDGSLGCPQPGEMYTQSLVSGYWIVFRAGTETFDFRVSTDGSFHRCELPSLPEVPAIPGLPGQPGPTPN